MNPIISVIVPNYNHAAYLKQRIESVLEQTYQQIEVIILDDYSTDNSKYIIEQYRHHPKVVHIVYNESNSGITFKQWQKGIELARGRYLWIAESDDISDKDFLSQSVSRFTPSDNIGLVYCQSISVDENGNLGRSWLNFTEHFDNLLWNSDFIMPGYDFVENYMFLQNSIPNASAVVFRKDYISKAGGVNSKFKINGDWDIYTRILSFSDIAYISLPLNYFRQHDNKGSTSNIRNGNNIKEYLNLLYGWSQLYDLSILKRSKIFINIFSIFKRQYSGAKIMTRIKLFYEIFFNSI